MSPFPSLPPLPPRPFPPSPPPPPSPSSSFGVEVVGRFPQCADLSAHESRVSELRHVRLCLQDAQGPRWSYSAS